MAKIRTDYVTNSSSSSFIISKKYLDREQIEAIREHDVLGEKLGFDCCDWSWDIDENDDFISGYTYMDNFDMYEFLKRIDVNVEAVSWSEYPFNLPDIDNAEENNDTKSDWRELLRED